jgi:catechol 2,3-dioxygenase-like lactoylglutathione lyase family enzyme
MLKSISISSVWVLDQDQALEFYVGKLGLEVRQDIPLGFMRWLTVGVPGQGDREILLELIAPPSVDEASAQQVRQLVSKGATGLSVGFTTDDCRATFEDLKAKGVEFTQEPVEHFYGTDMGLRDPFGNQIRVVQPAPQA